MTIEPAGGSRMSEYCEICTHTPFQSDGYDHDLRRLTLSNDYKLDEGSEMLHPVTGTRSYCVTTCKQCRGEFIEMLWAWCRGDLLHQRTHELNPTANIPIRRAGRTVLVTREEWERSRKEIYGTTD